MAITDIKKLNVRSPFFIEVVDEYLGLIPEVDADPDDPDPEPDPQPDPITEPVTTTDEIQCSNIIHFGRTVGTKKFKLDTTGRALGAYTFTIDKIKTPIKYRVYTEGETAGAYSTEGLDAYSQAWLEETGEDASSLSSSGTYPDGVSKTFSYTTTSTTVAISKIIIVELLIPIITQGNMSLASTSCQALTPSISPLTTNFVTVLTIESVETIKLKTSWTRGNPVFGSPSDVTITLNGTSYELPHNTNGNYGTLRVVFSDATPLLAPTTNQWIYNPATRTALNSSDNHWSLNEGSQRISVVHVNQSAINEGENTLIISTPFGVTWNGFVNLRSHPVIQEGGNNVIRTLYDGGDSFNQSYYSGNSNHYLWESEMEHTVTFIGGNTKNIKSTATNRMRYFVTYPNGYKDPIYETPRWRNTVLPD